jgi:hypothetical protein
MALSDQVVWITFPVEMMLEKYHKNYGISMATQQSLYK